MNESDLKQVLFNDHRFRIKSKTCEHNSVLFYLTFPSRFPVRSFGQRITEGRDLRKTTDTSSKNKPKKNYYDTCKYVQNRKSQYLKWLNPIALYWRIEILKSFLLISKRITEEKGKQEKREREKRRKKKRKTLDKFLGLQPFVRMLS